jgi:hypothetical protein
MEIGQYFKSNQKKITRLNDNDWKVALKKCKDHIRYRLFQKTLYGAHTSSNLGKDPFQYYMVIKYYLEIGNGRISLTWLSN